MRYVYFTKTLQKLDLKGLVSFCKETGVEGFDLAVRIGTGGPPGLVARRLGHTRLICCASPAYLAAHGEPRHPEDLLRHQCLEYSYLPALSSWTFEDREGRRHPVAAA